MRSKNAAIFLEILTSPSSFFRVKSDLSIHVLLTIASHGGVCDLKLLDNLHSTPMAIRQHVKMLLAEQMVTLSIKENNRRSKTIALTEKAKRKLKLYDDALLQWSKDYVQATSHRRSQRGSRKPTAPTT